MKPMLCHRRIRFTAAVMLFVWLLTLSVGIANACLLHADHARPGHIGGSGVRDWHEAGTGLDAQVVAQVLEAAAGGGEGTRLRESIACRTLCVAGQTALPKQKALAWADLHADPVLVATWGPASVLANPMPEAVGVALLPRPEPPVYIRFLRLTL